MTDDPGAAFCEAGNDPYVTSFFRSSVGLCCVKKKHYQWQMSLKNEKKCCKCAFYMLQLCPNMQYAIDNKYVSISWNKEFLITK